MGTVFKVLLTIYLIAWVILIVGWILKWLLSPILVWFWPDLYLSPKKKKRKSSWWDAQPQTYSNDDDPNRWYEKGTVAYDVDHHTNYSGQCPLNDWGK